MMITMLMIGCGADDGNGNRDGFARSDFSWFKYAKLKKIPRGAADTEPGCSRYGAARQFKRL